MNRTFQRVAIHATAVIVVVVGGAFVVAGYIPPPAPGRSLATIAASFQHHDRVRIAGAMFLFGGAFYVGPVVAYTAQMRRIEGPDHVMADIQLLSGAVGVVALQLPGVIWLAVSYYPDMSPSVIATLNAGAWFMLLGAVAPVMIQQASVACCILGREGDLYPRWLGYVCLWCVALDIPGVVIPFVKSGPLAWNGVLGFVMVATGFFVWTTLMWIYTLKAIDRPHAGPLGSSDRLSATNMTMNQAENAPIGSQKQNAPFQANGPDLKK